MRIVLNQAFLKFVNQPFIWVVTDFLVFIGVVNFVYAMRLDFTPAKFDFPIAAVGLAVLLMSYLFDTFSVRAGRPVVNLVFRSFMSVLCAGVIVAAFVYLFPPPLKFAVFWRGNLPISLFVFSAYAVVSRFLLGNLTSFVAQTNRWSFVGEETHYQQLCEDVKSSGVPCVIARHTDNPIATFLDKPGEAGNPAEGFLADISLLKKLDGGYRVILDKELLSADRFTQVVVELRRLGVTAISREKFYELQLGRFVAETLDEQSLHQFFPTFSKSTYVSGNLKRLMDIGMSSVGLVLSAPIIAVSWALIRMTSKGPAFFRQSRVGASGQVFDLVKMRSMRVGSDRDRPFWTTESDPRVTAVGGVLRKLHIDELPQFWNVLVGDMSLVGPRPERPEIVRDMRTAIPLIDLRHLVRPGMTGWAQVTSGYAASVAETKLKVQYDLYYIKNASLALDLQILLKTSRSVFWQKGR